MTQDREFYAATVDEALDKAAASLGKTRHELAYEVLDEGSTGFLGLGARDARVLVRDESVPDVPIPEAASGEEALEVSAAPKPPQLSEPSVPDAPAQEQVEPEAQAEVAPEELLEEIRESVASVLVAMGFEARVDAYDAGEYIAVDVSPDNTALFIGQKGETIDALQYLINASAYRNRPFVKRIIMDAEGYRQRRVEAVQGIAHRTARRAIREGQSIELPPMNPAERRVVHIYLQDNPGVTTTSEGSGDNRRVKISPS